MYLTRGEARVALTEGKKVRHFNFTSNEYLVMECGRIMTEDGYFFGDMFESQDWMETGWSIVEESPEDDFDNLFDAIKKYPDHFQSTAEGRATTTPSLENRKNHLNFAFAIRHKDWEAVKMLLIHPSYRRPFNGVCVCLDTYSDIPTVDWIKIVDLERDGKYI